MAESINSTLSLPAATSRDVLTDILRDGAQRLLAQAVEAEVAEWIDVARAPDERGRPSPGGSQWPSAEADDYHGRRPDRGPAAAGARSTSGRRSRTFFLQDSSSLSAKDQEPGGVDSVAVPERGQHGRLQRSPGGAGGSELPRPVGLDGHATERRCWEDEFQEWNKRSLERKAVRLPVGRRRAFQHPPGRRSAVHPGVDGRHGRRPQGADRRGRWLSRERTVVEGAALGREVARPGRRSEAGDRRRRARLLEGTCGRCIPTTREQRCWVHKTANVLDKLPKRLQPEAKEKLHDIWMAADESRCRARRSTCSWQPTRPSTPRRPSACRRIATCC